MEAKRQSIVFRRVFCVRSAAHAFCACSMLPRARDSVQKPRTGLRSPSPFAFCSYHARRSPPSVGRHSSSPPSPSPPLTNATTSPATATIPTIIAMAEYNLADPSSRQPHPYLHEPLLYISGVPPHVTDQDLAAAFVSCAPFRPNIPRDPTGGLLSGTIEFKYIEKGWVPPWHSLHGYANRFPAEKALATLQSRPIPGTHPPTPLVLSPYPSTTPPTPLPPPQASPRLVKHLPPGYSDSQLYDLFRPFGALSAVRTQAGFGKDTGIIEFWREEDARDAEEALHCTDIDGQNIAVQVYQSRRAGATMSDFNAAAPAFVPAVVPYSNQVQVRDCFSNLSACVFPCVFDGLVIVRVTVFATARLTICATTSDAVRAWTRPASPVCTSERPRLDQPQRAHRPVQFVYKGNSARSWLSQYRSSAPCISVWVSTEASSSAILGRPQRDISWSEDVLAQWIAGVGPYLARSRTWPQSIDTEIAVLALHYVADGSLVRRISIQPLILIASSRISDRYSGLLPFIWLPPVLLTSPLLQFGQIVR